MNGKIKNAFNDIKATEELKRKTYNNIIKEKNKSKKMFYQINKQLAFAIVICFIILSSSYFYFTPVYAISIDSDSSIELLINRFDKVVGINEYNGQQSTKYSDIFNLNYNDAINTIFSDDSIKTEDVSITIVGENQEKNSLVLDNIEEYIPNKNNIYCENSNIEEIQKANELGLSYGKYKAYLQLLELNPQITADEIKNLSMKQINEKINELSSDEKELGSNQNNKGQNQSEQKGQNQSEQKGQNQAKEKNQQNGLNGYGKKRQNNNQ